MYTSTNHPSDNDKSDSTEPSLLTDCNFIKIKKKNIHMSFHSSFHRLIIIGVVQDLLTISTSVKSGVRHGSGILPTLFN